MSNIVEFDKSSGAPLLFDDLLRNDLYIRLTTVNALDKLNYEPSVDGVRQFQADNDFEDDEVNGIVGIETFAVLIMSAFDNVAVQDVLSHLSRTIDNMILENNRDVMNEELESYLKIISDTRYVKTRVENMINASASSSKDDGLDLTIGNVIHFLIYMTGFVFIAYHIVDFVFGNILGK